MGIIKINHTDSLFPIAYALSARPGPVPAPPDLRGPRSLPSEGPGGPSAEGPSERAKQIGVFH